MVDEIRISDTTRTPPTPSIVVHRAHSATLDTHPRKELPNSRKRQPAPEPQKFDLSALDQQTAIRLLKSGLMKHPDSSGELKWLKDILQIVSNASPLSKAQEESLLTIEGTLGQYVSAVSGATGEIRKRNVDQFIEIAQGKNPNGLDVHG